MNKVLFLAIAFGAIGSVAADEPTQVVDEITVMGARDLTSLRAELVQAEFEFYDMYNDLNDDDEYDVICKMEAPIGSHIKQQVCLARVYRDALSTAPRGFDGKPLVGSPINTEKHNRILQEKLRAVTISNPQLAAAIEKHYALDQKFKREREKKFGDDDD